MEQLKEHNLKKETETINNKKCFKDIFSTGTWITLLPFTMSFALNSYASVFKFA